MRHSMGFRRFLRFNCLQATHRPAFVTSFPPAMCTCSRALVKLITFTAVFCIIFVDRGGWAVALNRVENDFDLTNLQGGIIGAAFMIGYAGSAFVFAHFSNTLPPMQLMAWGILSWIGAAVMCGLAFDFWSMLCARIFVGVGEAAYLVLAPPLIDSIAPRDKRSLWLGYFFMSIPVGFAIGNVIAGFWLNYHKVGTESWRVFFFFEAALMAPFFFVTLFSAGPKHMHDKDWLNDTQDIESESLTTAVVAQSVPTEESDADPLAGERISVDTALPVSKNAPGVAADDEVAVVASMAAVGDEDGALLTTEKMSEAEIAKEPFCSRLTAVLGNGIFLFLALGYAAQTFVGGAFSYFGIQYVVNVLKFSVAIAGLAFGLMTLFTGILGIWFGGWWLDRLRSEPDIINDDLKSTEKSVKSLLIMTLLAIPFAGAAFIMGPKYPVIFFILIAPGEFFMFATVAPINAALMWCVDTHHRALAVACSVFIQHLLGDAPAPVVVGWMIDVTGSMTLSLLIAASFLIVSVVLFGFAFHLVWSKNNARDEARNKLEAAVQDRLNESNGPDSNSSSRRNSAYLPQANKPVRRRGEDGAFDGDAVVAADESEFRHH